MKTWFCGLIALALVACAGAASGTGNVYMVASGPLAIDEGAYRAVQGATYDIEIWLDFSDDPTLGGGYDVAFNEAAFDFVSWTSGGVGDPTYELFPDVLDGLLESAGVADFSGISGPAMMATATFTLTDIAALGLTPAMTTSATDGPAGPWISAVNFLCCQQVEYSGLEFVVVPVPAAAWLMASGLGALAGIGRRRRAAA